MKRGRIAFLLVMVMIDTIAMSGCGGGKETVNSSTASTSTTDTSTAGDNV